MDQIQKDSMKLCAKKLNSSNLWMHGKSYPDQKQKERIFSTLFGLTNENDIQQESVRKLKARFCVRGDQQIEGVDFFDTYAPTVAWSTVRLLLILSVTLGLATKQVDYTLAFVHAELEDEVYVEMPRLFLQSLDTY